MGECTINCGHPLRNVLGISVSLHFPPVRLTRTWAPWKKDAVSKVQRLERTKSLSLQWVAVSLQSTSSTPGLAHCHFRSLGEAPWTNCFFSSGHTVQHIAFATISPFISEINYTPVSPTTVWVFQKQKLPLLSPSSVLCPWELLSTEPKST